MRETKEGLSYAELGAFLSFETHDTIHPPKLPLTHSLTCHQIPHTSHIYIGNMCIIPQLNGTRTVLPARLYM